MNCDHINSRNVLVDYLKCIASSDYDITKRVTYKSYEYSSEY